MKIKNPSYRKFLDSGIIDYLTQEEFNQAVQNCESKTKKGKIGKALLTLLYYTGARPNEILRIKAKDVTKDGRYYLIKVQGSKGGLPRTIYLRSTLPHMQYVYKLCTSFFDDMYIFHDFRDEYKRTHVSKRTGKTIERYDTTGRLGWHFKQWFGDVRPGGINPYFLRHSRFSKLSEKGLSTSDLRQLKGARSAESVAMYEHMSSHRAKKIARVND